MDTRRISWARGRRAPGLARGPGAAEADHLVRADVGLRLRRRLRRACRSRDAGRDRGRRHPARRPAGLRHQPGGQRLVRPPCRRHQRAAAADPLGPHARAAGASTSRIGWTVALARSSPPLLGPWGFGAAVVGLALAWAYSAPPIRLKRNGWWGNTRRRRLLRGPALVHRRRGHGRRAAGLARSSLLAALYSVGAHGIMTLNDFKSVEGDRRMGIGSLPVRLGVDRAARVACLVMAAAAAGRRRRCCSPGAARSMPAIVALLLLAQLRPDEPPAARARASWRPGTTPPAPRFYVLGMLVGAFALRRRAGGRMTAAPLGWLGIVRLGLVQTALGAIVVLTTSTLNRVMVVELALPAMLPGAAGRPALRRADRCARASATARTSAAGARPGSSAAWRCWRSGGVARRRWPPPGWRPASWPASRSRSLAFLLIGVGVGAAGTSLLVLLAKRVDAAPAGRGGHHRLADDDRRLRRHRRRRRPACSTRSRRRAWSRSPAASSPSPSC